MGVGARWAEGEGGSFRGDGGEGAAAEAVVGFAEPAGFHVMFDFRIVVSLLLL